MNNSQVSWIPYDGSEILIFHSTQGKWDTLFLAGRDTYYTTDNPLIPFERRFECQRLFARYLRHNDSTNTLIKGVMIKLTRLANGDAELYLGIQTRAGGYYSEEKFTLSTLDNRETETHIIGSNTHTDIVVFSGVASVLGEDNFPRIEKIWWSKKNGIVMYASNQGETWTLN